MVALPVIPVGQEARNRRTRLQAGLGKKGKPCLQNKQSWADGLAQVVECLPSKHEALEFKPQYPEREREREKRRRRTRRILKKRKNKERKKEKPKQKGQRCGVPG
jgi:hypothetical protein